MIKMAGNTLENMDKSSFSPMMQRYLETKEQYKDCILFYRLGDFYEMFFDDAILVSRELEITLTGKDCGQAERAPMCGVPHHAAESYIARLIAKGYKVAICEQLEDPKTAKGIVERGVIRVVTPGTIVESNMLEERKKRVLQAIVEEYIKTAEPVSSGAIMNLEGLEYSSATIRNEMAELEKMGYIEKTHTSSGRVPISKRI